MLDVLGRLLGQQKEMFVHSSMLIGHCDQHEELSWIDSPRVLKSFLDPFGLQPRPNPQGTARGYRIQ